MGQGFFHLPSPKLPEVKTPRRGGGASGDFGCHNCPMKSTRCWGGEILPYSGHGAEGVLIVLPMPEWDDFENESYLTGPVGDMLSEIPGMPANLLKSCWVTAAARCRKSEQNEEEARAATMNCAGHLRALVAQLKPKLIITLGPEALTAILGHRLSGRMDKVSMSDFYGLTIPDQELGSWLAPVGSPYISMQMESRDPIPLRQLRDGVAAAWKRRGEPLPKFAANVRVSTRESEIVAVVENLVNSGVRVGVDYETSGLKPQRAGHHIACASVAWRESGVTHAVGFPWLPKSERFVSAWRKLLENNPLVAHNLVFESAWSRFRAGLHNGPGPTPQVWACDTATSAHCLNNTAPVNLKYRVFAEFGVLGYDSSVDQYLKPTKEVKDKYGANALNRIDEAPMGDLCLYCAYDSAYSLELSYRDLERMDAHTRRGFDFFMAASPELGEVSTAGMITKSDRVSSAWEHLTAEMESVEREILATQEARQWHGNGPFNHRSGDHLKDVLNLPKTSKTDEAVLEKLPGKLPALVVQWRKMQKLRDTYLAQFKREAVDEVVRPFFNINTITTFRSSSDSPNFQNIPKRNKIAQKTVRSVICPRPGNKIVEWDYKGVEVVVGAAYHCDPTMISYIKNPANDMHRDTACDLFFRKPAQFSDSQLKGLLKCERQNAKGGLVFPAFYGSVFDQMAPDLWESMAPETRAHVVGHGITDLYPPGWERMKNGERRAFLRTDRKNPSSWVSHVAEVERILWEERFPVYADWKRKQWELYKRQGFVELYTGFRCYGPMKRTEVANYPIQGSAFHVLLWVLTQVAPRLRRMTNGRSQLIGQIHDALVGDIHPHDEALADQLIHEWGITRVQKAMSWLNCPLTIEKEASEIDGSWAAVREVPLILAA